jgi:hypothetical protein
MENKVLLFKIKKKIIISLKLFLFLRNQWGGDWLVFFCFYLVM